MEEFYQNLMQSRDPGNLCGLVTHCTKKRRFGLFLL
jgi:hypothetical protein